MEWISIESALPTVDDDYLTCVMDNGCSFKQEVQRFYRIPRKLKGMYADSSSHWELTTWDDNIVTHWMPLPNPPKNNDSEQAEYGCMEGVAFAKVKMCNSSGEEVICKCGKPAGTAIIGKEDYVARCNDCMGV